MIKAGKFTYGVENITIRYPDDNVKLIIGKYCSIAQRVTVFQKSDHRVDWITTFPFGHVSKQIFTKCSGEGIPISKGDITIGNDVWIGEGVTIMGGAVIGDGAVISANSHVMGRIKPYSVVGGNPAQFYCFRFNEELIKKLLEIKWWDWSEEKVDECSQILCSTDYLKIMDL
jgi:acetyltransferase-like isoleucine patch superfamily enzyme